MAWKLVGCKFSWKQLYTDTASEQAGNKPGLQNQVTSNLSKRKPVWEKLNKEQQQSHCSAYRFQQLSNAVHSLTLGFNCIAI